MAVATTVKEKNIKKGDGKMTSNKKQAPKKLKKFRVDAGYTIYTLADRLGVNFSTVSYWENGVKHPRHTKIIELEDLFNTTYRELFSDLTPEEIEELEKREREMRKQNEKEGV